MIDRDPYPPIIGDWYKDDLDQLFEIVAIDDAAATIEVQFSDGEIAEYDMETWDNLDAVPTAPPEDWSAPFDDLEKRDIGDGDIPFHPEDWSGPLDDLERLDK